MNNAVGIRHRNLRDRIVALEHYGGLKCACCGEKEFSFLSLDHIADGEGSPQRKEMFGSRYVAGHHMYRKVRLQGYPEGYQVLCMNCQVGRRDNGGVCPHKRPVLGGRELMMELDKLRVGSGKTEATTSKEYKAALANVMRKAVRVG